MAIRFTPSRPGAGFEAGGVLDESAPSASLAGQTDAATRTSRLAALDDDELIGLMRAWRRLEWWLQRAGGEAQPRLLVGALSVLEGRPVESLALQLFPQARRQPSGSAQTVPSVSPRHRTRTCSLRTLQRRKACS